jgi:hypothetical protein
MGPVLVHSGGADQPRRVADGVVRRHARDLRARGFSAWGGVSDAFWIPISLFSALHIKPVQPETLTALQGIRRVALGLSAVGIATSASMAVSFVLGLYLLGLPHNFGQTYQFDALLVIAMGVLACSRAGDAWSVDAWLKGGGDAPPSGEYTWPVRAIWLAVSLVFSPQGSPRSAAAASSGSRRTT